MAGEPSISDANILIVEDSETLGMLTELALKDIGVGASRLAGTVEEALRALEHDCYTGCILDIRMHQKSSIEVAERLEDRAIPYVLFSADIPPQEFKNLKSVLGQIQKPTPISVLAETIEQFLLPSQVNQ